METKKSLAIIIVTFQVRDLAIHCVRSVLDEIARSALEARVIVVDNASTDGTMQALREAFPLREHPQLNLLETGENLGFAAANNHAMRMLGFPDGEVLPDYVFLLNPDTEITPGALTALVNGLEESNAGLAGARLSYGDASFQHAAFELPGLAQLIIDLFPVPARVKESRLNGRYPRALYEQELPFDVGHPLGATMLLRREVIEQTGLFDEQFFLYCEEVDWAIRIHQAGWPVVCVPTAHVIHFEGQSSNQVKPQSLRHLWTARLRFYRKHYPPWKHRLAVWSLRAGINRAIQQTARQSAVSEDQRAEMVTAYRDILRLSRRL